MNIATYPAHLSPYPSISFVAVRRVSPCDYPDWDGLCLKVGQLGLSLNWRRKG